MSDKKVPKARTLTKIMSNLKKESLKYSWEIRLSKQVAKLPAYHVVVGEIALQLLPFESQ